MTDREKPMSVAVAIDALATVPVSQLVAERARAEERADLLRGVIRARRKIEADRVAAASPSSDGEKAEGER